MDYSYFDSEPLLYQTMDVHSTPFPPDRVGHRTMGPLDASPLPDPYCNSSIHLLSPISAVSDAILAETPLSISDEKCRDGDETEHSQTMKKSKMSDSREEKTPVWTPAQSRRKAQNRAAQRAFRERKEKHVHNLEAKLSTLESSIHLLQSENERLNLAMQNLSNENETLRAGAGRSLTSLHLPSVSYASADVRLPGERTDDNRWFNAQSFEGVNVESTTDNRHAGSHQKTRGRTISASQVWDVIQAHPLVKQDLVDISHVCKRLKSTAKCDGYGLMLEESTVLQAVEEASSGGIDQLL